MTETSPSPATPPKSAPRKRRMTMPLLLILLFGVFIAGVALAPRIIAALPAWMSVGADRPVAPTTAQSSLVPLPPVRSPEPAPATAAAPEPSEPASADAAPAGLPYTAAGDLLGAVQERLTALEDEIERQDAEEGHVSAGQVAALGSQINQLFQQVTQQQERLATLEDNSGKKMLQPLTVLALSRLRQAVEQGVPYAGALDGAERLIDAAALPEEGRTGLLTLDAHKTTGVASTAALRDSFAADIPAIIEAESMPANASWWDKTLARIEGIFTVRPTGEVKGQDTPALVARAEAALARGEVDTAIRELQALPPTAALAAADWLQTAQTRQSVVGAVGVLESAVLDTASTDAAGTGP
jgi:hypothetical protein